MLGVLVGSFLGKNPRVHHVLHQTIVEGNQVFLNVYKQVFWILLLQRLGKCNVG